MMEYLTRPGFNGGGAVSNRTVLPKRKPAAEVKKRKKINYEKIKQYLGKESQELIEKELGFAEGGAINPRLLKQRFMQLVSSIQEAEPEEIPGIVAQAKRIRDQIEEINLTLAPDKQIKITAQGIDFDNPLLDAAKIAQTVDTTQEVTGGLTKGIIKDVVPETLTRKNPALKGQPEFIRGDEGTLADPREKEDLKPGRRVGIDPRGNVVQASMKMGRRTDQTLGDYLRRRDLFKSIDPTITETEGSFAEGGSVETPKRGLVDEPGSYSQSRYKDPDYKKNYYEKNKEKILKQQKERYEAQSPEEKKARIEKQIKRSQTEEGKKLRAEGFKRRKLAKSPLSAVDVKVLNRTKLIITYQKIINDIIKAHDGLRPSPEILSQLIDIHYDIDPELQKAWKKVAGDVPFSPRNLSPAALEYNLTRAMAGTTRVTADNFKKELNNLIKSELKGTGTTVDEFIENGFKFNETYLTDNYKSPTKSAQYQRRYDKVMKSGVGWNPEGAGAKVFFGDPQLNTSTVPTKLNTRLGTKGFYDPGKFVRAHYFGTIQAKKLYDLGLLSDEAALNFKERYTWKPDYINKLQGRTYDADVYKALLKYTKHKDKSKLADEIKVAATNAKKLGLDIDELVLDNKTGKFNFIDKGRVFQKGGDREVRYLAKNAVKEIATVEALSGKALTPAAEADIRKAYGKRANSIIKQIQVGINYNYPNLDKSMLRAIGRVDTDNLTRVFGNNLFEAINKLPKNSQINVCRKLNVKSVGDLVKGCPTMIRENPDKALNAVEEEAKKIPKQTGDEVMRLANKIRQGLKFTGFGLLAEVPVELGFGLNPFVRGKPTGEIIDESLFAFIRGKVPYGAFQDLNRPRIEEFVNTTQRAGALKFYDYYKDQARLSEIDKTLRRLSADQPDADTSDLLQEKELIEGRLGTEPTKQDIDDFEIFLRRRAGQFEANKKARGQYGPFTNIIQGTTPQSFSDAAEELNIDLGGILGDLVLPERQDIVPTTTRAERRDRDFMKQRAEGIKQVEQNILFPATGSSFAGGGIAKLAGDESGKPPESGPTPDGPEGLFSALKYVKKS